MTLSRIGFNYEHRISILVFFCVNVTQLASAAVFRGDREPYYLQVSRLKACVNLCLQYGQHFDVVIMPVWTRQSVCNGSIFLFDLFVPVCPLRKLFFFPTLVEVSYDLRCYQKTF